MPSELFERMRDASLAASKRKDDLFLKAAFE
jgi:hypothetical protein